MGIKAKILSPSIIIILFVAAAILVFNILRFSVFVDEATVSKVEAASKVAASHLDSLHAEATALSQVMAGEPALAAALEAGDRDALLQYATALESETGDVFCTIADAKGLVLARSHAPLAYGDSVALQANVRSALNGIPFTTVEEGSIARLSVRAGTPVYGAEGRLLGVVSVGFRLDTDRFVNSIKEMLGCETTVILGDERIASTILGEDGQPVVGTRADAHIVEIVSTGNTYSGRVDIAGRVAVCKYSPVYGANGKVLAMVFVGQYFDEELRTIWAFVSGGLVITLIMLAVSVTVILIISGRIVRPIRAMTDAASALAIGDTDLDIRVNTKDEMRTLADAFNSMIANTRQQVEIVERIAGGGAAAGLEARSEKDVMNRALDKLNTTLKTQAAALREEHERVKLMLDATPLASRLWNRNYDLIECNEAAVKLFGLGSKREYLERYYDLSPEYQPDGRATREKARAIVREAFECGTCTHNWMYQAADGSPIPAEVTLVRVPYGEDYVVAGYSRDLREQKKMMAEIESRDSLLQTVNHSADMLLRAEPKQFAESLRQCMGLMAEAIGADRMYLCKNLTHKGRLCCTQLYEWVGDARPLQGTWVMNRVPYDEKTPEIKEILLRGECVHKLVRALSPTDRAWLGSQDILAVLIAPVFIQGEFWGFVGFDRCHSERLFTENEESIMRSGSLLVADALVRNEYLLSIQDSAVKLESALADAKSANEAKSNFLAQMSHEIRTPLNVVVGLSELMLDNNELSGETEAKLENIHTSGMTILSIVNDILDISKIESGKFEIYPTRYDTPSLINDIITLNIVRIEDKDIEFKLLVNENLPCILYGDDLRVKQIFNNLLSNAFKYTYSGTVEWHLSYVREEGSVWLISSVRDTGIGIKPEDIKKLFSDYNQVDAKTNRKVEGSGLGLAITKRLVEMMDGNIRVESEYGKGSTFHVRLRQAFLLDTPIGKEVAKNLTGLQYTFSKRARNTKLARVDLSYAHVLVVDDIVTNLDVVKGMMRPYKLNIDCATSGAQAIEMIRAGEPRYSAIFMDHMMPGMDGIEAARIIREEIGTDYAKNIPIVALTANAIVGNEEMFLSKGFQSFISKPIDITKLDAVLRHWVRDKSRERRPGEEEALLSGDEAPEAAAEKALPEGLAIEGVDIPAALERFGGSAPVFIDILRSYANNTRPLFESLRQYLREEKLEDYAIVIHGVKGSSYGIQAQEVGKAAEALENAAQAGDLAAAREGHPAFEELGLALLVAIGEALEAIDAAEQKPLLPQPDPALLAQLREACRSYEMDRVDSAMELLCSFSYEKGEELVAWLRRQIDGMNFETITSGDWPAD